MREVFGAFLTDPIHINETIFDLWLEGLNKTDAPSSLCKDAHSPSTTGPFDKNVFSHDLINHYRLYDKLEHYLMHPNLLQSQLLFQIPRVKKQYMIELYYSFTGKVARWFLGDQQNKKMRKGLDEMSECAKESLTR